jgi:hypothetical protein
MMRLVDGLNPTMKADALRTMYKPAQTAYRAANAAKQLRLETTASKTPAWRWLLEQMR